MKKLLLSLLLIITSHEMISTASLRAMQNSEEKHSEITQGARSEDPQEQQSDSMLNTSLELYRQLQETVTLSLGVSLDNHDLEIYTTGVFFNSVFPNVEKSSEKKTFTLAVKKYFSQKNILDRNLNDFRRKNNRNPYKIEKLNIIKASSTNAYSWLHYSPHYVNFFTILSLVSDHMAAIEGDNNVTILTTNQIASIAYEQIIYLSMTFGIILPEEIVKPYTTTPKQEIALADVKKLLDQSNKMLKTVKSMFHDLGLALSFHHNHEDYKQFIINFFGKTELSQKLNNHIDTYAQAYIEPEKVLDEEEDEDEKPADVLNTLYLQLKKTAALSLWAPENLNSYEQGKFYKHEISWIMRKMKSDQIYFSLESYYWPVENDISKIEKNYRKYADLFAMLMIVDENINPKEQNDTQKPLTANQIASIAHEQIVFLSELFKNIFDSEQQSIPEYATPPKDTISYTAIKKLLHLSDTMLNTIFDKLNTLGVVDQYKKNTDIYKQIIVTVFGEDDLSLWLQTCIEHITRTHTASDDSKEADEVEAVEEPDELEEVEEAQEVEAIGYSSSFDSSDDSDSDSSDED